MSIPDSSATITPAMKIGIRTRIFQGLSKADLLKSRVNRRASTIVITATNAATNRINSSNAISNPEVISHHFQESFQLFLNCRYKSLAPSHLSHSPGHRVVIRREGQFCVCAHTHFNDFSETATKRRRCRREDEFRRREARKLAHPYLHISETWSIYSFPLLRALRCCLFFFVLENGFSLFVLLVSTDQFRSLIVIACRDILI